MTRIGLHSPPQETVFFCVSTAEQMAGHAWQRFSRSQALHKVEVSGFLEGLFAGSSTGGVAAECLHAMRGSRRRRSQ